MRCPFSETVFWEETYSRAGGASSEVPTAMWTASSRGQLLKCAKAASLRAALPEEASYTAEEMAGKIIEPEEIVLNRDATPLQAERLTAALEPAPNGPRWTQPLQDAGRQAHRACRRSARMGGQADDYLAQALHRRAADATPWRSWRRQQRRALEAAKPLNPSHQHPIGAQAAPRGRRVPLVLQEHTMNVINVSQRTPEWHAWRAAGVTASEAAVILNRSPYKTPWRLWAERTGVAAPEDLSSKPCVQRGIQLEDQVRRGFEERHGTILLPLCAESTEHPVLRAHSMDSATTGEPVELKVPTDKTYQHVVSEGEQALAYQLAWVQLQHQLYVTEAQQGWLVFDPCRLAQHRWSSPSNGTRASCRRS